ncbi:hypothetical protein LIER_33414 [Lithospermum erythrorhizon]|uniref:Uncharacterized protein n=1 Tax=Lithospermum erythrorhizon TaxID=34254 RepID=A0AAV3RWL9_LITER
MELDVTGLVGCPKEGLSDPINCFLPPTQPGEKTGSSQALIRLNGIHISFVWSRREKAGGTGLCLFYYITEKSILVMIDPRPSLVPGELGLLSKQS